MEENLKEFLKETKYCDFEHPAIQQLAQKLTDKCDNPKEKAVSLFYWVRDNIYYRVGFWNRKASETLAERSGTCTNNANLLVALLRASNIPAGYSVIRVNGQEFFGPVILPTFKKRISKNPLHIYTQVWLNGKWIKCDPSIDMYFSEKTSYFNPQSKLVDWDGENNTSLNLNPFYILEEKNLLSNIDEIIAKKPQTAKGIIIEIANLYIKFLRNNEKIISRPSDLEPLFRLWLKKNYLRHNYLYSLNSFWFDLKTRFNKNGYEKES